MATSTAFSAIPRSSSLIAMPRGQSLSSVVSHAVSPLGSLVSLCSSPSAAAACRSWNPDNRGFLRRQKSRVEGFVCRAATYSVTLKTPQGEVLLNVSDDTFILDAAEDNGIKLPYSCRSGACSSCAAVLKEGKIDQSDQSYLEEAQVKEGYVLTCVAYPLSDLVMETHQEHGLY